MDVAGRKSAIAAVLLTGLFLALFIATLMSDGNTIQHRPPVPIFVGLAILYLAVALALANFRAKRALMIFGGMLGVQATIAVLMGMLYSALSHGAIDPIEGFVYSLTGYLPGLLMQSGVVFLSGPVLAAYCTHEHTEERSSKLAQLSAAGTTENLQSLVDQICEVDGIAGVLVKTGDSSVAGGIWKRDPDSAYKRVALFVKLSCQNPQLFMTGDAALWAEHDRDTLIALSLQSVENGYIAKRAAKIVHQRYTAIRQGSSNFAAVHEHECATGSED